MGTNNIRKSFRDDLSSSCYKKTLLNRIYPLYWDEGYKYYPKIRKGFKNPNKRILRGKMGGYKNWKRYRRKQYKNSI